MNEAKGLLDGILVLDLADEKGSFCSKLLADLGATAIKIEFPEGSRERKSLAFAYHNANKLGITLDARAPEGKRFFRQLVNKADVLIETFPSNRFAGLDLNPERLARIAPGLIHLSITGFGRSGPKRNFHFTDSVGSAAGGQMYLSGSPAGPPVKPPGLQSCYAACLHGAAAVLLGLRKRKITGRGSYFDLSIQEAVASTLDHALVDYFREQRIAERQGHHYEGRSFSIVRCRDGFFQISILSNWETLLELMAAEGKAADLTQPQWRQRDYREQHYEHIFEAAEKWTRGKTKRQLFELGQAMRFPWAPVAAPGEVLNSPQLKARGFFIKTRLPGTALKISVPGLPYRFSSSLHPLQKPAPLLGEHTEQVLKSLAVNEDRKNAGRTKSRRSLPDGETLKGTRVVDLTRMLSGPLATRILADFGAEVIKVQSSSTSHGAERNDTAQFAALNRNKRSICLDLSCQAAREVLMRLVAVSDVVVENYSPRVMANWGFRYERLKKTKPGIIMASISAMGAGGPWKDYAGFSPTFHALSGMLSLMPHFGGRPVNLGHAYGDVIAGLYAALAMLAALEYRERTGEGLHIDLSAYEALCTLLGPEYMISSLERKRRIGGAALGARELARAMRIVNRLKAAASCRSIPAAVVQNAEDLAKDRHLIARRFFTSIKHPVLGTIRLDRSALWPWKQSTKKWKPAPLLGEDNHYVFVELLRMSDAEVRALTEQGAIR